MTDKELLELAASAAAIDGWFVEDDEWYGTGIVFTDEDDCNRVWNPLTDDGDTLRLAVNRKIFKCHMNLFLLFYEEEIANGVDESTATRRAVVRAVAEIGKDLK